MKLSPTEIYQGRKIFLIGSTGFLGKVTLSMLLHRFPNVGKVYVTVRARSIEESRTRFWNNVITAPPFDPLRERYGAAFEDFIRDKVRIVNGDIGEDRLGMTEEEAEEVGSSIDVLVNSAGHGPRAPVLEITDEQWHQGIDVYFMNVVRATRLVAPIMVRQKAGAIVNISTAWAFEPSAMFPTSAVFRAGLASFTKIFADTYAADNIRMNNVLPGWIDSLPATEERRRSVPMQRYGKTEEIAATVAFLASEDAGYITGQNIRVDGGLMRSV